MAQPQSCSRRFTLSKREFESFSGLAELPLNASIPVNITVAGKEFPCIQYHNQCDRKLQSSRYTNVEALKIRSKLQREAAAQRLSKAGPPLQFRLIDCEATCERKKVVLVDWHIRQYKYTAISHTWGEEAYKVFDCACASDCSGCSTPRYDSSNPCPGTEAHGNGHRKVIAGILSMCERLMEAGCEFLWHDGVCIAQHNAEEVTDTIRHMGWVYANASDTVIFLHNVGDPRSLLSLEEPYKTRWNTRVWTLQEAILSRRRRYCIRLVDFCEPPPNFFTGPYDSEDEYMLARMDHFFLERGGRSARVSSSALRRHFETNLEQCYQNDSCIAVIEEEQFWSHLLSLYDQLNYLLKCMCIFPSEKTDSRPDDSGKYMDWIGCLDSWITLFGTQLFEFPDDLYWVLFVCAQHRDSKHEGDRINSVLGLAGITDFVAPKDGHLEASTIEFIKRVQLLDQQQGLALLQDLLFTVNAYHEPKEVKRHTWLPDISKQMCLQGSNRILAHYRRKQRSSFVQIMENGMVQLRGRVWCIAVQFTLSRIRYVEEEHGTVFDSDSRLRRRCASFLQYEHLYRDCRVFCVDVDRPFWSALADSEKSGKGLKEVRGGFENKDMRHADSPNWFVVLANGSGMKLGKIFCPVYEKDHLHARPVFHGQELCEGSSVSAHLVFGKFGVHNDKALIVRGGGRGCENLEANCPVSKLGFFKLAPHVRSFIFNKRPFPITCLDELLID